MRIKLVNEFGNRWGGPSLLIEGLEAWTPKIEERWRRAGSPPLVLGDPVVELDFLPRLEGLEALGIVGVVASGSDAPVAGCKDLQHLFLATDASNAIEFRSMASLRILELAAHRRGVEALPPGIERLSVQGCKWATLEPVSELRVLRDLQLVSRRLRSLEGIEGCEALVRLGLAYAKLERPFQESKVRSGTVRQLILDTCSKLSSLEGVGGQSLVVV